MTKLLYCQTRSSAFIYRHVASLTSFLPSVFSHFSCQNGVMSGLMQILLLKVSAHITEQLGMAPGGEFREAFKEVSVNTHVLTHLHIGLCN